MKILLTFFFLVYVLLAQAQSIKAKVDTSFYEQAIRIYASATTASLSTCVTKNNESNYGQYLPYRPTVISFGFENIQKRLGLNYTYQFSAFGFKSKISPFWPSPPIKHHQLECKYIHPVLSNPEKRFSLALAAGLAFGFTPSNEIIAPATFRLYSKPDSLESNTLSIIRYTYLHQFTAALVFAPILSYHVARGVSVRLSPKFSQGLNRTATIEADLINFKTKETGSLKQDYRNSYFALLFGISYDLNRSN